MMQTVRALRILFTFVIFTLPLIPLQALFVFFNLKWARTFPVWYHKKVSAILGLRVHISGEIQDAKNPVLVVANHASWLDIIVLSQLTPLSLVAKQEIASWPFFSMMARLQRTIFVDRARKSETQGVSNIIMTRLSAGDNIVFFPEGTSSDGNVVLPFNSSLFAAVKPTLLQKKKMAQANVIFNEHEVGVQTVSVAYTRLGGLPLGRQRRYKVAWVGDAALLPHIWTLIKSGTVDVYVKIGKPVLLDDFKDRKQLCRYTENEIRTTVSSLLVNEFRDQDD